MWFRNEVKIMLKTSKSFTILICSLYICLFLSGCTSTNSNNSSISGSSGSSTSDTVTCKSCKQKYNSGTSNSKSILLNNLCVSCYNNLKDSGRIG